MSSEEATVILSAYPENQYERFLEDNIKDGLLYLKNKEALRRDSPVVNATRIATVSFNGLLCTNNIARFNENVNLKRVQNNGMALQFIPEKEKSIKVCNAAKRENPACILFFPERNRNINLYSEIFSTRDKTAIQNIPDKFFIDSLKNYLQQSMSKEYNNQPRMAFSSINKRITDSQHELIKQSILAEYGIYDESYSLSESEIIDEFKEWAKQEAAIQKQIKHIQGENNIMENATTGTNQTVTSADNLTAVEYLMQKINGSGISIHLSKEEMKEILDTGKNVQKMSVKYGTSQDIEKNNEHTFNGYGTYVVSLNEENAKQLGIKIASRKYGGTFYINNQPLSDFLQEKNFSPYWSKRLEQFKSTSIDELTGELLKADTKGNPALEKEQAALTTLFGLGLVDYKREQTYLYSVDIPDNDNTNYLLYGNPIGIEHANKINEQLEKIGANWRVSRNDIGQDVYFDVLSKNVFNGSQKQASEFLQKLGYVGMEMDKSNYILFNDKDMNISDRVQYMKDKDGEVYGFAYEGAIYCDEDLLNSNTLAHEYTHIWDRYVQNNNPELWRQGKDILKGTSLWQSVVEDKNYENLTTDDAILSECHSRIVGDMAGKILENIAKRDGGLTKDQVIDWDKEVSEYITDELVIKPELGEKNKVPATVRAEYLKQFLSMPMKDLMNEINIAQNNQISEIQKMISQGHEHQFSTNIDLHLPSHSWSEELKEVITNTSYQSMLENRELQIKGKAGNEQAAVELVSKIVNKEVVSQLAEKYPDAIVIPIPSMETADKRPNAIPMAYAREYEKAGLNISTDIIEIDSAHHTGKNAFKRTVNRPHFDGEVIKGKEYIIVDDVFTMGGTINSLKNFIEDKGGRVVSVSTLTPGVENSKILGITDETVTVLKKIDQKGELLNAIHKLDIAENYEALTDPIGKYIVKNREKIINEERTRRAQNNSKYNDEQNQRNQSLSNSPVSNQIDQILDKEIESVQENGGLSDAAIEADIKAEKNQKADYIDEPEQNPTDDFPMFTLENDHFAYPQELYNAFEKFNSIEPEKWNLPVEGKVAVKRLIDVAEIKGGDKNKSIERLNNYILSEEYKREESSYSKILTPVFEAYNNKDETFSYSFSVDEIKHKIDFQRQKEENSMSNVNQPGHDSENEFNKVHINTHFETKDNQKLSEEINSLNISDIGIYDTEIKVSNETPFVYQKLGFPNREVKIYKDKIARALLISPDDKTGTGQSKKEGPRFQH